VAEDALLAEMRALQDRVTGINGTAVASRDGLIVRGDTGGVDPDNLAALAATWLALSQRMSREVGQGTLREAMTRSAGGYVAIYAVGARAVLVLIGDEGLDVARLHRESLATVEAIGALLAGPRPASLARWPAVPRALHVPGHPLVLPCCRDGAAAPPGAGPPSSTLLGRYG
jgi:predicted regulator of Ras-like GTPase activity (Roadblock/LC7/MglB family)